jgi:hypothetical protein
MLNDILRWDAVHTYFRFLSLSSKNSLKLSLNPYGNNINTSDILVFILSLIRFGVGFRKVYVNAAGAFATDITCLAKRHGVDQSGLVYAMNNRRKKLRRTKCQLSD